MRLADLIPPPYEACPYCGADAFGVAAISADAVSRRCVECGRPNFGEVLQHERLPPIRKAVLYLDQFALSNFARIEDPHTDPMRRERAAPFQTLYDRVGALVAVQALVCPSSGFHTDEVLPQLEFESFMRAFDAVQDRMSGGVSFREAQAIEISQLVAAAGLGPAATPSSPELLEASPFGSTEPHFWSPRLLVGVSTASFYSGIREEVRAGMVGQGSALQAAFLSWMEHPTPSAADQFTFELESYGPAMLRAYVAAMDRLGTESPWV